MLRANTHWAEKRRYRRLDRGGPVWTIFQLTHSPSTTQERTPLTLSVSNSVMNRFWGPPSEVAPKLTAAVLFLSTGVVIASTLLAIPSGPFPGNMSRWERPVEIACKLTPLVFLCACSFVFFRTRFGSILGLFSCVIALAWLVRTEFSLAPWNSWIFLNYGDQGGAESGGLLAFMKLRILSAAFLVTTIACCLLRLLPAKWTLRRTPFSRLTWPAVVAGFVGSAAWFFHSVVPYNIPGYDHGMRPEFRILHVQKHGLHFQEMAASAFRDGRVYVWTDERRLFQYGFNSRVGRGVMPYKRLLAFAESQELWTLHTQPAKALRSWHAEGWYVVLKDTRLLAFTSEYRTVPPEQIAAVFREIEELPVSEAQVHGTRDVCLGFCYDPVAALGFSILQQRTRLLIRSSSGTGWQ